MSNTKGKKLIFIRHAHREILERTADNGLSEKGRRQSEIIKEQLVSKYGLQSCVLYSSPKLRCIETLRPLATYLKQDIQIHSALSEKHPHESESEFKMRIIKFLEEWKQSDIELTLACSHGDWLPFGVYHLTSTYADFEKGEWAEIIFDPNQSLLRFRD